MRLHAQSIGIERGGRRLIQGLSFDLEPGEALVVTGPNGAGKSTLLRAIAGLLPLAQGVVTCDGETSVGAQAHYLGHLDALKGSLTAVENLAFMARMLGGSGSQEAARAVIAQAGLARIADLPAAYLSAGQRRRQPSPPAHSRIRMSRRQRHARTPGQRPNRRTPRPILCRRPDPSACRRQARMSAPGSRDFWPPA